MVDVMKQLRVVFLSPVLLSHILVLVVDGQTTNCPLISISDLGNITTPSSDGLLAFTLGTELGVSPPSIQILQLNKVCVAQGTVKDTFRSVSMVVRYLRESDNMEVIVQVQYNCIGGTWGFVNPEVTMSPTATLTTATRTDCVLCIDPALVAAIVVDPDTHCSGN